MSNYKHNINKTLYCTTDRNDDGPVDEFEKTVENTEEIRKKEHLSEGDMVLNAAQMALMEGTARALDLSGDGSKTNGGKWPKTGKFVNVPYTVDPKNLAKWSKKQKANFNKALKSFETNTCIRYSTLANEILLPDFISRNYFIFCYFPLY